MTVKYFKGKKVQLFPNDTYKKFGIVKQELEQGLVIEITEKDREDRHLEVGDVIFYPYSKIILKIIS